MCHTGAIRKCCLVLREGNRTCVNDRSGQAHTGNPGSHEQMMWIFRSAFSVGKIWTIYLLTDLSGVLSTTV